MENRAPDFLIGLGGYELGYVKEKEFFQMPGSLCYLVPNCI